MMPQKNRTTFAFAVTENFISSLVAYHLAIAEGYRHSRLTILLPNPRTRQRSLPCGLFNLSGGRYIDISYCSYAEFQGELAALGSGEGVNILLWNHDSNRMLRDLDFQQRIQDAIKYSGGKSALFFYPDGLVGIAWNVQRVLEYAKSAGLDPSNIFQLFLREDSQTVAIFERASIGSIVAPRKVASDALTVLNEHAKNELAPDFTEYISLFTGENPLFIALRPWHCMEFHSGLYGFGLDNPTESLASTIVQSVRIAQPTLGSAPWSSIILCPDPRTTSLLGGLSRGLHELFADIPIYDLRSLLENKYQFSDLSLDGIVSCLSGRINLALYSFDSNTTVLPHLAGLRFMSIHGSPESLLRSQGARDESIGYISGNVRRIVGYASKEIYAVDFLDSTLACIQAIGLPNESLSK